uniref:pentatricopeptide repeat-containing protein At5g66520-like n=1 Tax=Erigeron canadensis TaxID=72917 RepID=UPI001CB92B2E|nr:pentatricopeptide repeat-containing protein At5g66520-like [Erigeron canadensis]XP_043613783.1 pentatricopeptide repeat-containing protein At5g66520-like [Erigeron canadensis]
MICRHSSSTSKWISAIKNASSPHKSIQIYIQMHQKSIPIDSFTLLYTLSASTHLHNLPLLHHLHAHISKLGFTSNVYIMSSLLHGYSSNAACFHDASNLFDEMPERSIVTWNTMITGFSRSGNVDKARTLFDEMPLKNVGSWSAMIAAYVNSGDRRKGLGLFGKMVVDEKIKPDVFTLSSVVGACGHMGAIGFVLGKSVHGFVIKNEWDANVKLGTALIDMYAKCGYLKVASVVFDMMRETNVVSWTALICGAAQHGYVSEAIHLFERMQKVGVKPNELTFTGILSACVQAGLVDEGRKYFKMIVEYGLKPNIHHYCCMVNLFGKAGELEDMYEVIMNMQIEPNMNIWGSFLNSCKAENNFEMAERVIDKVIEMLRPEEDGGVYNLIADLFVMGEKWDDAERMRRLMVRQNVKKARGASYI